MIARKHSRVKHPRRKKQYRQPPPVRGIISPSEKAAMTRNQSNVGRISFAQFRFLVEHGYDASTIRTWTAHRAGKRIEAIENRAAQAGHDELDREFDQMSGGAS